MIRFIDLGKQIAVDEADPEYPRQFAFFNTINDCFVHFDGFEVFDSWDDFIKTAEPDESFINRVRGMCPEWVFKQ
jgi:hypothetical protein